LTRVNSLCAGPGPAADLDGINIAFGQVVKGMDVVSELAGVPTIRKNETLATYNALAKFLGDDRADKAKSRWGKPLVAVLIMDAGFV
jgi:peptidyl-prolyl cis-trans isomerase B (cyclophilin B)